MLMLMLPAEETQAQQSRILERLDDIWQGAAAVMALERRGAAQAEDIRDLQQVALFGGSICAAHTFERYCTLACILSCNTNSGEWCMPSILVYNPVRQTVPSMNGWACVRIAHTDAGQCAGAQRGPCATHTGAAASTAAGSAVACAAPPAPRMHRPKCSISCRCAALAAQPAGARQQKRSWCSGRRIARSSGGTGSPGRPTGGAGMQQLLGQYLPHHWLQLVQDMSYGGHTRGVPAVPYIGRVQHLVRTTNRHPILSHRWLMSCYMTAGIGTPAAHRAAAAGGPAAGGPLPGGRTGVAGAAAGYAAASGVHASGGAAGRQGRHHRCVQP